MTISTETRKTAPFVGNDTASVFPFTFKVLNSSDILVVRKNNTTEVESTLVKDSDYTVSLNSNQNTNAGGSITLLLGNLATGFTLVLTSDMDNLQPMDLTNRGGFFPEVLNDTADRQVIQIQQMQEGINRTPKLQETSAHDPITIFDPVAGGYLRYDSDGNITSETSAVENSDNYTYPAVNAVTRTLNAKISDFVNIVDFGAVGDGVTDNTSAVENAINTGKVIYIPTGTFLMNITITQKVIFKGNGSTRSLIRPFNTAIASVTYRAGAPFWTYHSEFRDIGFSGISKTGIGFTFGQTNVSDYVANDEYMNNVKFFGCFFSGLEKGVQFPFGNIGSEFYSCGFSLNKYGVYMRDNDGNGLMHAGNKFFYAGEMNSNDCAVYIHNKTVGFGAITFNGTILENNGIAVYYYNNIINYVGVVFENVWLEGNGYVLGGTFDVDQWTGTTLSTTTVTNANIIMDGDASVLVWRGGFFTDAVLNGTNNQILVTESRVEAEAGNSGNPCVVADNSSFINLNDCWSNGKITGYSNNVKAVGRVLKRQLAIDGNATTSNNRPFITEHRKSAISGYGASKLTALDCYSAGAATTTGTFALTGALVSDGVIFNQCTEFTRAAFLSNQFTAISGIHTNLTSGKYYTINFDLKVTSGAITVYSWNRASVQFLTGITVPTNNKWFTFAGIGRSDATQALSSLIDFSGTGVDATWRISAIQVHEFDTLQDATDFLESGVYGY